MKHARTSPRTWASLMPIHWFQSLLLSSYFQCTLWKQTYFLFSIAFHDKVISQIQILSKLRLITWYWAIVWTLVIKVSLSSKIIFTNHGCLESIKELLFNHFKFSDSMFISFLLLHFDLFFLMIAMLHPTQKLHFLLLFLLSSFLLTFFDLSSLFFLLLLYKLLLLS